MRTMLVGGSLDGTIVDVATLSLPFDAGAERYLPHSGLVHGERPGGIDGFLLAESEFPSGSLVNLVLH